MSRASLADCISQPILAPPTGSGSISTLIPSTTERHDLKPVSVRCRHQPVKTFMKVPVTPGGTIFPHLLERQEGMDGYDCNPCLKSAGDPTVRSCAPAEVVRESGPKGPAYAANALKSQFRSSNNNNNRTWPLWLQKKSGTWTHGW